MYTTKRKFQNLLNSVTNASSSSLANTRTTNASSTTLPADIDSRSKKRKLERPISAYVAPAPRPRTAHPSSSAPPKLPGPLKASRELAAERPNYAPWDREQFLQRLKTFRHVDRWSAKPAAVNEVQWARRGWSCVGKDRVGCVGGCGREVVVKVSEDDDEETVNHEEEAGDDLDVDRRNNTRIVQRYSDMIVSEHEDNCLWRQRGCDDTIYRLPLTTPSVSIPALAVRYNSLAKMKDELPATLSSPELSLDIDALSPEIFHKPGTEGHENTGVNAEALVLALFGWQSETGHINGLVTCEACFRRLGLWLFKPRSDKEGGGDASMSRLDVVAEHRDYCPWVNAMSQSGGTPKKSAPKMAAGWEVLLRVGKQASPSNKRPISAISTASAATRETSDGDEFLENLPTGDASLKDKERWEKLKRLRKIFNVKRKKKPGAAKSSVSSAAA